MKIRYGILGYSLLMLLVLFIFLTILHKEKAPTRDIIYYNEQCILIEEAIHKGLNRHLIEEEYHCQILFTTDEYYEIYVRDALLANAMILDYIEDNVLLGKFIWSIDMDYYRMMEEELIGRSILVWSMLLIGGYVLLGYVYYNIMRPFGKLQMFSKQVARGNLDFNLPSEKNNYFGAFMESFDLMREELKQARDNEYRANQSKKELIAELSHDIKTPISTILATCEVIELKEKNDYTLSRIKVIESKANMIHELVNNLFQATLEELSMLKVDPTEEHSLCIAEMFSQFNNNEDIKLLGEVPPCLVYMDKLRLWQVIDNCLNNAWKYARTVTLIDFIEENNAIKIRIKDEGMGVAEDELPLLTQKYYRGSNASGKEGSGLGLYLSKVFMKAMEGDMEYYNDNGFVVELILRKI